MRIRRRWILGRVVGNEAFRFHPGSELGFGFFGELGVQSAGESEDREASAGSFANVDVGTGGRWHAFDGDLLRHHESHLDFRIRFVVFHEHGRRHGNLLFGLVRARNVAEQFHETAVATLGVDLGGRGDQHQVGVFADFKVAVGFDDLVFG